jgi:branched-chain amino acid transport system substrate-binding protein
VSVATPVQYYAPTPAGAMGVKAEMAALQGQGVQVIVSFSIPVFTATALASAASIGYHPVFVVSNVGSDPPTLSAILTGGALGVTLPAALITGMVSDTYGPLVSDSSNPWVTLFKSIKSQYAPSLPWDGNVLYGMVQAYVFVEALRAAGQNPSRADIVRALENGHLSGPGIVPFGFSSSNHLGYLGVQVAKTNADGSQTAVGPVYMTDDSTGGSITQSTTTPATPPPNGIPNN